MVENARRVNAQMLRMRDAAIRKGYEALRWRLVSRSMVRKFVIVETEVIAEGKCARSQGEEANRCWK